MRNPRIPNCSISSYISKEVTLQFDHFKTLSSATEDSSFDQDYHHLVSMDADDICRAQGLLASQVSKEEVRKAIKELNRGKAAEALGITAEHFVYAEDSIIDSLCLLLNKLFETGEVTDTMKIGLVTPFFKKIGRNTDSKNYRGITVIPIFTKVLENSSLEPDLKHLILEKQNKLQCGRVH